MIPDCMRPWRSMLKDQVAMLRLLRFVYLAEIAQTGDVWFQKFHVTNDDRNELLPTEGWHTDRWNHFIDVFRERCDKDEEILGKVDLDKEEVYKICMIE